MRSFRRSLIFNLTLGVVLLGAAMLGIGFYVQHSVIEKASVAIMNRVIARSDQKLANERDNILKALAIAVKWAKTDWSGTMKMDELDNFFSYLMMALPEAEFTHITRYSGDSYALRRGTSAWTSWLRQPEVWGDRTRVRRWTDDGEEVEEGFEDIHYDLEKAPWFAGAFTRWEARGRDAPLSELLYLSEPYKSSLTGETLVSMSLAFEAVDGLPTVVGVTISAKRVTEMMRQADIGEAGMIAYLYGSGDKPEDVLVLGVPNDPRITSDEDIKRVFLRPYTDLGGPVAALFNIYLDRGDKVLDASIHFTSSDGAWWGRLERRFFPELDEVVGQPRWYAVVVPEDQIQAELPRSLLFIVAATAVVLVLAVFRAIRLADGYSRPIEDLVEQGRRMQRLDFRRMGDTKIKIREIGALADTLEGMRRALQSYTSINEEVRIADSIVRATIPSSLPRPAGYQIEAFRKSADDAGGESFDVLVPSTDAQEPQAHSPSSAGRVAFLLLSPRESGVEAAVTSAQLRAIFRTGARTGEEPRETVRRLGTFLHSDIRGVATINAWVASLEPKHGQLQSVSAGCEAIIHYQASSGRFTRVGDTGAALGNGSSALPPPVHDVALDAGDIFVVATNGVIDALNIDRERFRMEKLERAIADHHAEDASAILSHLDAQIDGFTEGMRLTSDMTVMIIKRCE